MMMKFSISKNGETWFAVLQNKVITYKSKISALHDDFYWNSVDSVEAHSFGELMVEIGDKKWIDQINKNE